MPNRSCNLECVKNKGEGEVIEFIGPVKIVLVDQPKNMYRRKVWAASFIVLAQMMLGATTMTVLFYMFTYQTGFIVASHVFLCTVGYQLCFASGILSMNRMNGAVAQMRTSDRQFEHVIIQVFGTAVALVATLLLFFSGALFRSFTLHSICGILAGVFAILSVLSGLLLYEYFATPDIMEKFGKFSRFMDSVHKILGCVSFFLSSVCFILGIMRPRFQMWVPVPQMLSFLIFFCIIYTAVAVYRPVRKVLAAIF